MTYFTQMYLILKVSIYENINKEVHGRLFKVCKIGCLKKFL